MSQDARLLLEELLPRWRAALPASVTEERLADFICRNEAQILGLIAQRQREGPRWFDRFNPAGGVPRDGTPAWLRALATASVIFDNAVYLWEHSDELDPRPALDALGSTRVDLSSMELGDEDGWFEAGALHPEDLAPLLGTDAVGWTDEETGDLLADVLESESVGGYVADDEVRRAIAERLWQGPFGRLELVSIDKAAACAFIEAHHATHPYCNPRGMMYALGAKLSGEFVAVATAGTPTGRWSQTGGCPIDGILELTRIASIGGLTRIDRRGRTVPVNASSALAARVIDLLPFSGRRGVEGCRFVTYSLIGERASTYLALVSKGLRPVALRRGKAPSGARGSTASLSDVDKIVWEAGPAARQPDWKLLPEDQRAGAARAFRGGTSQ